MRPKALCSKTASSEALSSKSLTNASAGPAASEIALNVRDFAAKLRERLPESGLVLCSVIRAPQKEERWGVVDDANDQLEALAASLDRCEYVDLHPALELPPAGSRTPNPDIYKPDGLHYHPEAYEKHFTPAIRPVVERLWAEVTGEHAPTAHHDVEKNDMTTAWDNLDVDEEDDIYARVGNSARPKL